MAKSAKIRFKPVLLAVFLIAGCQSDSAYERDAKLRGPESNSVWRDATSNRYDGNLPDSYKSSQRGL